MRLAVAAAFAFCLASAAQAQRRDSVVIPLPGARTLHGYVADAAERSIDSVEIFIQSAKRSTFTRPDGSFRFDDLKPGKYKLRARKLGYYPQARDVTVGDRGGATAFYLVRNSFALPPIVSSAPRGGLSGVVGDTSFNIIEGATVWVLASDRRAQSDSTGAFHLDLNPGRHMVRVERAGYAPRLLSVTIPSDSGRRVVVWLAPAGEGTRRREQQAILELSMRLTRRNPVWSKVYTREDIQRSGSSLDGLASSAAVKRVPDYCLANVDGGTVLEPLWVFDPADIETMEVYSTRPARRAPTSVMRGGSGTRIPPANDCDGTRIYLWLRK
jgi:hypothetical protein